MKFGLSIPTLTGLPRASEPVDGGWRTRWRNSYEVVQLAESLGFDLATIGHHRFTRDRIDSPQPMVTLAALAARTNTIRLCTNIMVLPLHHPIDIAEQIAIVDEISDGRVILGAAIGYRSYEFEQIGLNYKERVSRFEEAVQILRQAWSADPVNFDGRHFSVHGAEVYPKPVQRPGPPIWAGAQVEASVARAARLADGWLTDNIESATSLGPRIAQFRRQAQAAGRAGTVVLNRKIGIGPDRRTIETEWLPPILDVYREYLRLGVPFEPALVEKLTSGSRVTLADLPADQIIGGTPEDCIAALRMCIDATQCDAIVVDFGRGAHGDDYTRLRSQIELFGREVIPAFA